MDPFTAIAIAKSIGNATGLTSWITGKFGDVVGEKTAEKIVGLASALTGKENPEEALKAIEADKELQSQLRKDIMDNEQELNLAYLEDVQSARQMYQTTDHTVADEIARGVIKWNIWFIFILIAANLLAVVFIPNPTTLALISNLVGVSIGYLWSERATILNFFYGSSQGSKDKAKELASKVKNLL